MSCPFSAIVVTAPNDRSAAASRDELRIAFSRVCPGVDPGSVCLLAVADPNGARIGSGGGTINALDAAARALTAARRTVLSAASGSSAKGFNDGDEEEGGDSDDASGYHEPIDDVVAVAGSHRILIVHSGGDSQRSPLQSVCGKAWCTLSSSAPGMTGGGGGSISSGAAGAAGAAGEEIHPSQQLAPPRSPLELLLVTLFRLSGDGALPPGSSVVACADVLLLVPSAEVSAISFLS